MVVGRQPGNADLKIPKVLAVPRQRLAYCKAVTTIVIPAHNEGRVIGRLLESLISGSQPAEFRVLVVANGCTDNTVEIAASFGPCVQVLSIPVASKYEALVAADRDAADFPRIYVDADVEIRAQDVRELVAALAQPGVLAAAPERVLALSGRPWPVRWFYDVWRRLPEARRGLWGRGVIAVGAAGQQRIAGLPSLIGDDLAASLSFEPGERRIVSTARAIVHPPRTAADLLRRRIRVATGVTQIEQAAGAPASTARTRPADLAGLIRADPHLAPRVAFFLAVAVTARLSSRRYVARGDFATWHQDESSRSGAAGVLTAPRGAADGRASTTKRRAMAFESESIGLGHLAERSPGGESGPGGPLDDYVDEPAPGSAVPNRAD
jgi:Glycosyl transferase family 2